LPCFSTFRSTVFLIAFCPKQNLCIVAIWPTRVCFAFLYFLFPIGWTCRSFQLSMLAGVAQGVNIWGKLLLLLSSSGNRRNLPVLTWQNRCHLLEHLWRVEAIGQKASGRTISHPVKKTIGV
jgi:hypothetical protein